MLVHATSRCCDVDNICQHSVILGISGLGFIIVIVLLFIVFDDEMQNEL